MAVADGPAILLHELDPGGKRAAFDTNVTDYTEKRSILRD
jgi:hypothetical protein